MAVKISTKELKLIREREEGKRKNLQLIREETERVLYLIEGGKVFFDSYIASKRKEIKSSNLDGRERSSLHSKLTVLTRHYKTIVNQYEKGALSLLKDAYHNP